VAMPIEVEPEHPVAEFPWRPPFTVDLLFELPPNELRYQVLEGALVVAPAPEPRHSLAADRLGRMVDPLLAFEFEAITNAAVRMPNGDGPVPDLLITSADLEDYPRGIPAELVHTVVEVVSPSNATDDRVKKTAMYAAAGIPCYWRIELKVWREHLGPVPAIVVRLMGEDGNVHQMIYPAGETHKIPLAVDRGPDLIVVELDPAVLVGPKRR
jgi:Uma2 family endonuclease